MPVGPTSFLDNFLKNVSFENVFEEETWPVYQNTYWNVFILTLFYYGASGPKRTFLQLDFNVKIDQHLGQCTRKSL